MIDVISKYNDKQSFLYSNYSRIKSGVAVLQNGQMPAGMHSVAFDARHLSSDMYLYRIEGAGFAETRKMLLMK